MTYIPLHWQWEPKSNGIWEAESRAKTPEVLFWRIGVCNDGTFAVCESDAGLTNRRETFTTLNGAKAYCNEIERSLQEQAVTF